MCSPIHFHGIIFRGQNVLTKAVSNFDNLITLVPGEMTIANFEINFPQDLGNWWIQQKSPLRNSTLTSKGFAPPVMRIQLERRQKYENFQSHQPEGEMTNMDN